MLPGAAKKKKKKKKESNELMYKTERDSQTQQTDLWLPKGKELKRDEEVGINIYALVYIK